MNQKSEFVQSAAKCTLKRPSSKPGLLNVARSTALATAIVALPMSLSWAQTKADALKGSTISVPVKGMQLSYRVRPQSTMVDSPVAFHPAGSRLLYVETQVGKSSEIVVLDTMQQTVLAKVPIGAITTHPTRLEFAAGKFLIWWQDESGASRASLVDRKGKVRKKFGPAKNIDRGIYEGKDCVIVHRETSIAARRGKEALKRHTVELFDVESGRRVGKKGSLDLSENQKSNELDFRFSHFAKNFSIAVGIKGGEWNPKENQQSPDTEAWYLMPAQSFSKRLPITDVLAHRKNLSLMEDLQVREPSVVALPDRSALAFMDEGKKASVGLAEPFHHYDPSTLQMQRASLGRIFFSIQIDPVHPDAVAKRRQVKAWIDLYEYDLKSGKAKRRGRYLPTDKRGIRWAADSQFWAIMPRHRGFDRGAIGLDLFKLD